MPGETPVTLLTVESGPPKQNEKRGQFRKGEISLSEWFWGRKPIIELGGFLLPLRGSRRIGKVRLRGRGWACHGFGDKGRTGDDCEGALAFYFFGGEPSSSLDFEADIWGSCRGEEARAMKNENIFSGGKLNRGTMFQWPRGKDTISHVIDAGL